MITTGRRSRRVNKKSRRGLNAWLPTGFHPWLSTFMLATFFFQVLLVPQVLFPIRTPLRIAAFVCPLIMLFLVPGKLRWSPLTHFGMVIAFVFLVQLANPNNNSLLAACASIGLNLAILSPIFWVPRQKLTVDHVKFIFILLWAFNATSAFAGILEVYLPGRFSRESQITLSLAGDMAEGLKVVLADGTSIYRPMGLTDTPGGAAVSGYITVLTGTGLLLTRAPLWGQTLFAMSIIGGVFCIFVCQVRSTLIITLVCEVAMFVSVAIRGEIKRLGAMIFLVPGAIVAAAVWAFAIGGDQVSNRFATLMEGNAGQVYYENRGEFLLYSIINELPEYPLGAGLGRYGMVHVYFGDKSSRASGALWAEIQSTAWLFDGGVILVFVYYSMIVFCIAFSFRLCLKRRGRISEMATIVLGLNMATLATTFGSVPFIGPSGLTFWIVNASLATIAYDFIPKKLEFGKRIRGFQ